MVRRSEYTGLSKMIWQATADKFGKRQAQAALAQKLALTRAAISSRLRDRTSWKAEEMQIIAEWLGLPIGALYGIATRVPVMGAVAANPKPGLVREASDQAEEFIDIPQRLLAFTVYDASMVPLARPGQRVLVNPAAKVLSGDLVVAHIIEGPGENSWLFKRYERQKIGKGFKALLQSVAPGFPTLVLPEAAVRLWKVVGLWLLAAPRWSGAKIRE
jgi:SOS-response transcriptional repressor LexA